MSYALGILLSLIAAVCYGISAAMQKYAVAKITAKRKFAFSRLFTNWGWMAAIGIGLIGSVCYVVAMRFATLFSVQVFLSLTILIPIFAGFTCFKEKMKVMEWLCVIIIIAGVMLTIL